MSEWQDLLNQSAVGAKKDGLGENDFYTAAQASWVNANIPPGFFAGPPGPYGQVQFREVLALGANYKNLWFICNLTLSSKVFQLSQQQISSIQINCCCDADGTIRGTNGQPYPSFGCWYDKNGLGISDFVNPVSMRPRFPGDAHPVYQRDHTLRFDPTFATHTVGARVDNMQQIVEFFKKTPFVPEPSPHP